MKKNKIMSPNPEFRHKTVEIRHKSGFCSNDCFVNFIVMLFFGSSPLPGGGSSHCVLGMTPINQ